MKNRLKYYLSDGKSYYLAAKTLMFSQNREKDNQLLLMPILYLYRHSLELLLKYHIMKFLDERGYTDILNYRICDINGNIKDVKLLGTHNIKKLFDCFLFWNKQTFCPKFTDEQAFFLQKNIKHLCELDKSSDYFRYPTGKDNKFHKRHYVSKIGSLEISPEINNKMDILVNEKEESIITTYSMSVLHMQDELKGSIELLLKR